MPRLETAKGHYRPMVLMFSKYSKLLIFMPSLFSIGSNLTHRVPVSFEDRLIGHPRKLAVT